ncbi:hypothetical protein DKX38_025083 [Salix brachista]|uniref:Auxin-responsive protein n=1 Tax=Salix brachista TaxID=2182728 RepID=A0A5N5JRX0_9ROSI|nr:hypothetical protein DKX38_025083 [Salix brachista]
MSNMQEDKKSKVKKGWLAVRVGLEDEDGGFQRFVIPISYLYHPLFKRLLEKAHEVYGYHTSGGFIVKKQDVLKFMISRQNQGCCDLAFGVKRFMVLVDLEIVYVRDLGGRPRQWWQLVLGKF